jgi:hypothetical protein
VAQNGAWNSDLRQSYILGPSRRPRGYLTERWSGGRWVDDSRSLWDVDDQRRLTAFVSQEWTGDEWKNTDVYHVSFSPEGGVLSESDTSWSKGLLAMCYASRNLPDGRPEFWRQEEWQNGVLYTGEQKVTSYDAEGHRVSEEVDFCENGRWIHDYRMVDRYDDRGRLNSIHHFCWVDGAWVPSDTTTRGDPSSWFSPSFWDVEDTHCRYSFHLFTAVAFGYDGPGTTPVAAESQVPSHPDLSQNYPNPFNPSTDIEFRISEYGGVKVVVYDLLGREVAVLVNEKRSPGSYHARFDGGGLPSGVYLCRLETGSFKQIRRMVLVR